MRRLLLTVGMLLMGMALVGGAAVSLVGTSLLPLDQEVGTHASAAGAVLEEDARLPQLFEISRIHEAIVTGAHGEPLHLPAERLESADLPADEAVAHLRIFVDDVAKLHDPP